MESANSSEKRTGSEWTLRSSPPPAAKTTSFTTHLAALHVYSSLLVTAQVAAARRLYLLVSPPRKSLPEEDPRPEDIDEDIAGDVTMHGLSRMEGRVFGTLALAPVALRTCPAWLRRKPDCQCSAFRYRAKP